MRGGKLRHRVALQEPTQNVSGRGGVKDSWNTYATVWAEIMPMGGRELFNAQQVVPESTHKVTLRGRQPVKANHRIVFKGREFGIDNVNAIMEVNQTLVILCKELPTTAPAIVP